MKKRWNELLDVSEFDKEALKTWDLAHIDPGILRERLWVKLIPTDKQAEYKEIFHSIVPNGSETASSTIHYILCTKQPVPYEFVRNLTGLFLKVFGDECLVFCAIQNIVENVYPKGFFIEEGVRLAEVAKFVELVKILRPKIVKALVLKIKGMDKKTENDFSALNNGLKNLCLEFFFNFFCGFGENDAFRIFDYLFIQGFDFLHKFLISLISSQEKQILSNIHKLSRSLSPTPNRDVLIFISTLAFSPILSTTTSKIEILLRKCTKKPKYTKIDLKPVQVLHDDLLTRIKNAKSDFKQLSTQDCLVIAQRSKHITAGTPVLCLDFQKLLDKLPLPKPLQFTLLGLLLQTQNTFDFSSIISLLSILSPLEANENLNFLFSAYSSTLKLSSIQATQVLNSLIRYTQRFLIKKEYFEGLVSIEIFLAVLESNKEFERVLDLFEIEPKQKSFKGSYLENQSSEEELENEEGLRRPENSEEFFPDLVKNNQVKDDRSKCLRLCGPTCVIF